MTPDNKSPRATFDADLRTPDAATDAPPTTVLGSLVIGPVVPAARETRPAPSTGVGRARPAVTVAVAQPQAAVSRPGQDPPEPQPAPPQGAPHPLVARPANVSLASKVGKPSAKRRLFRPTGPGDPAVPPANASANPATPVKTSAVTWGMLAIIAALALYLRLRDPLSSGIMGAEDPYRHVERTWDLLQGKFEATYPPGLNILLLPFAAMGPGVMSAVARFLPPVFGVSLVVGVFMLCRRYTHPVAALTAALLAAVIPEAIRRTDILFPTALDLALLPWFFLATLIAAEGSRRALVACGIFGLVFLFVHPWVVALLAPPLAVFWFITLWRRYPDLHGKLVGAGGGVLGLAILAMFLPPLSDMILGHAIPKLGSLLSDPGSALVLPQFVDLPGMLTIPVLILGAVGIPIALVRRTPFATLGLLVTVMTLPFVLVDWFGIWYIPHRTVVYMSLGVLMLASLPIGELLALVSETKPTAQRSLTFGVVALSLLVTAPAGLGTDPWYRIYTAEDFHAWDDLNARGTDYVMAGSWESRVGYRSYTANDAVYNPTFFQDPLIRGVELQQHPHLVVLIDKHTRENNLPTDFLDTWQKVGQWGDISAYTP